MHKFTFIDNFIEFLLNFILLNLFINQDKVLAANNTIATPQNTLVTAYNMLNTF